MTLYLEKLKSSPYVLEISNDKRKQSVKGILTAPIQIRTASTYDALSENRGNAVVGYVASYKNMSTMLQAATHQVWRGVEVPEFTFQFSFVGISSVSTDVLQPAEELLTWPVPPKLTGGFFEPPATQQEFCFIKNNWIFIDNLFPVAADISYNTTFDKNENAPTSCEATISFVMGYAPTALEVSGWFS